MQKIIFMLFVSFIFMTHSPLLLAQNAESKKSESQASPRTSSKISSTKIMINALLLAEIYRKIQKVSGSEDSSQISPLLNQLNGTLDEVIAFKDSFTPQKRQKVEGQLFKLKNQIQIMAKEQKKDFQSQSLQLTSTLLDLVDTLLDKSKGNTL